MIAALIKVEGTNSCHSSMGRLTPETQHLNSTAASVYHSTDRKAFCPDTGLCMSHGLLQKLPRKCFLNFRVLLNCSWAAGDSHSAFTAELFLDFEQVVSLTLGHLAVEWSCKFSPGFVLVLFVCFSDTGSHSVVLARAHCAYQASLRLPEIWLPLRC